MAEPQTYCAVQRTQMARFPHSHVSANPQNTKRLRSKPQPFRLSPTNPRRRRLMPTSFHLHATFLSALRQLLCLFGRYQLIPGFCLPAGPGSADEHDQIHALPRYAAHVRSLDQGYCESCPYLSFGFHLLSWIGMAFPAFRVGPELREAPGGFPRSKRGISLQILKIKFDMRSEAGIKRKVWNSAARNG